MVLNCMSSLSILDRMWIECASLGSQDVGAGGGMVFENLVTGAAVQQLKLWPSTAGDTS